MNYFIFTEMLTEDVDVEPMTLIIEAKMTLEEMKDALAKNRVVVKFIKIGNRKTGLGTNRVRYMYCTRSPTIIKQVGMGHKLPGPGSQGYKGPKEVIPVFDLVKNAWRSFDVRTVKSFKARQMNMVDRILRRNIITGQGRYDTDFKRNIFRDPLKNKFVHKESVDWPKPILFHALETSAPKGFGEYLGESNDR